MSISALDIIITISLLSASALFSGLTLGLMSLSEFELKRKAELGDKRAAKVFPIRENGSQLLVTLLVGNVLVNAALTVILNSFVAGAVAVVISTALITVFGEIIPQSLLKKHGLSFGASLSPLIRAVMFLLTPISLPLATILDQTIGAEVPTIYSKNELIKIMEEHEKSDDSEIEADELRIVEHALKFGDTAIEEVMTPKSVVVGLEKDEIIDHKILKKLHESGNSRFPVYEKNLDKIVGVMYLRDMVLIDDDSPLPAKSHMDKHVFFVNETQKLDHLLNAILKTKNHLFVVVNEFQETVGIITMEDIIEEIIGTEIVDEFDKYDDMREVALHRGRANKRTRQKT